MKIAITDFWWKFENENNFFVDSIREIRENVKIVNPGEAELLLYSCFGDNHHNVDRANTKKIFYTGENLRPNFNECDASLTFDFKDYDGKNVRMPLWLMQYDWHNKGGYVNPEYLMPVDWMQKLPVWDKPRDKFLVAIFNRDHIGNRVEFLRKITQYKPAHGFGEPFKNWFYGESEKLNILSQFKFTMCFENGVSDGYHTEKLVHAKMAGCIPVYWANETIENDFHSEDFINLHNFESMEHLVQHVIEVDKNSDLADAYRNAPLFKKIPTKEDVLQKFEKVLRSCNL